ncbi:MAG: chemotaxis-specific protein-glutamate methyltransferase CheB [Firmicutes bacterium]|nr:chemotaxis-specific protein-glutamate methyltransferase CheB [Bacillota bacterium]
MELKIKVLIADDSEMVCKILAQELAKDPMIEVVGTAPDAIVAREMAGRLKPDVLLLDIEMPGMDGLAFLEQLMKSYSLPVIIVSSLAKNGSAIALRALELGAADVMAKPGPSYSVKDMCQQLLEKIKAAAYLDDFTGSLLKFSRNPVITLKQGAVTSEKIIAIGAPTGATKAVNEILTRLPGRMPPILIVQHMSPYFTKAFADRLNDFCALEVKEAEDQEPLTPGKALLAPGNQHLVLKKSSAGYFVEVKSGPLVLRQRPSIEVLFRSVALYAGPDAIGVLLAGMGNDGPQGLLDLKNAGAFTIAQDNPGTKLAAITQKALELNAVTKAVPLENIAQIIVDSL